MEKGEYRWGQHSGVREGGRGRKEAKRRKKKEDEDSNGKVEGNMGKIDYGK